MAKKLSVKHRSMFWFTVKLIEHVNQIRLNVYQVNFLSEEACFCIFFSLCQVIEFMFLYITITINLF